MSGSISTSGIGKPIVTGKMGWGQDDFLLELLIGIWSSEGAWLRRRAFCLEREVGGVGFYIREQKKECFYRPSSRVWFGVTFFYFYFFLRVKYVSKEFCVHVERSSLCQLLSLLHRWWRCTSYFLELERVKFQNKMLSIRDEWSIYNVLVLWSWNDN